MPNVWCLHFFFPRFHFHNGAEAFVSFFRHSNTVTDVRYPFGILSMYVYVTRKSHALLKFSMEIPRNGIGWFFAPTKLSIEISYCIYVRIFRQRFLLWHNVSSSKFLFFLFRLRTMAYFALWYIYSIMH